MSYFSIGDQV
ncbi:hypothetical protein D018_5061A, partial [Vibrio parahaemolyticus VP2007-007]